MCIAIYSPIGNDVPVKSILQTSWNSNDDGAGFAFNTDDGRVKIVKGLMTFDSFYKTFKQYSKEFDFKNRGVLIHFRIQTHGGVNAECTHPFPIVDDPGTLHKLEYTSPYAVIHNGIISLTSSEAHRMDKMSDTMVFVSKYLTRIASYKNWLSNPKTMELIYELIDSKMAILDGNGRIYATAGFTKDETDGNYYSNQTYKEARVRTYSSASKVSTYDANYYKKMWNMTDDEYDEWEDSYYRGYGLSSKSDNITIQKMGEGQMVLFDDGDMLEYDDNMPIYRDRDGNIYCGSKAEGANVYYTIYTPLYYFGTGEFLNGQYESVNYYSNRCVSASRIDWGDTPEYEVEDESEVKGDATV